MVFCSSISSGRVRMSNRPVTSNSSVSSLAIEISSAVRLWIGSPMARIACAKPSTEWCARHVAGLEMHLGGAVIVAGDEAVEDLREKAPFLRAEPAHDAEIDRHQLAVVVDEQVAGMHVGVEEAVAQRVAQEGLDHRAAERLEVEALGFEPGAVGERRRLDPFEREHVARGAVPVHRRARGNPDRPWCSPPSRRARRPRAAGPSRPRPCGARSPPPRSAAAAALRPKVARRVRATKVKASRSALKRRSMPGRSTFTATARRAPPARSSARCTCAIDAAATGGPNAAKRSCTGLPKRVLDRAPRPRPAGTAPSCPAGSRDRARTRRRPRPGASPGTGRASHRWDRAGSARRPAGWRRPCWPAARSARQRERAARRERQRRRIDQGEHALAREHEAGARETGEMGERGDHLESFRWSSLPGSTRQSISFARCSCEEDSNPGSEPGGDACGKAMLN